MCRLLPYRKEEGHEGKKRTELLENGFIIPRLSQGGEHFGLFLGAAMPGGSAAAPCEALPEYPSGAVVRGSYPHVMAAGAVNAAYPGKVRRNGWKEHPEADAVMRQVWRRTGF